ncbi:MAG: peptidoglycan-binding domain-containing protein [Candidatus Omnitrophota bacterium]|nr:peptidoglycan-binding domain-containing protein [Candidatus Omnitrophota bacterium]
MLKKLVGFVLLGVFVISVSGCAGSRQGDLQMQGLRNQISALEAQLQVKDEEIDSLKEASVLETQGQKEKIICEVKSRPNIKQVQIALRNAGFDPGCLDAKMGKKTRSAIKAFQAANNLTRDGKVGKRTWLLLRNYLEQKVK